MDVTTQSLGAENKSDFIQLLVSALEHKFDREIPENYGDAQPWSLINLIQHDRLDHYQLIYLDGLISCGSGGIVRSHDNKKIYQAAFRGFSCQDSRHVGLGLTSYLHTINTKHQIERAKYLECDSVVLSFNEYNVRLFEVTKKHILPKALPQYKFTFNDQPILFNGVLQWLLTLQF